MNFNADFHPFCGPERCPSYTLCGPQGLNPAIIGLILDSTLILVFTFLNPERPFYPPAAFNSASRSARLLVTSASPAALLERDHALGKGGEHLTPGGMDFWCPFGPCACPCGVIFFFNAWEFVYALRCMERTQVDLNRQ